jgi:hypothetical protein
MQWAVLSIFPLTAWDIADLYPPRGLVKREPPSPNSRTNVVFAGSRRLRLAPASGLATLAGAPVRLGPALTNTFLLLLRSRVCAGASLIAGSTASHRSPVVVHSITPLVSENQTRTFYALSAHPITTVDVERLRDDVV